MDGATVQRGPRRGSPHSGHGAFSLNAGACEADYFLEAFALNIFCLAFLTVLFRQLECFGWRVPSSCSSLSSRFMAPGTSFSPISSSKRSQAVAARSSGGIGAEPRHTQAWKLPLEVLSISSAMHIPLIYSDNLNMLSLSGKTRHTQSVGRTCGEGVYALWWL